MPTTAPKPTKKYTLVPAGTHVGRVYRFMNLGTRLQEYQGQMKDYPDTLVSFSLELPLELNKFTVKNEDGTEEEVEKPFVISSREFTLSMGPKSNLRPFVEGIIGTRLTDDEAYSFELEDLIGKTCLVNVVHKPSSDGTRTYANLASVQPVMKGMDVPEPFNEPVIQDVNVMTQEEIDALPQFLRDKMVVSDEYKARFGADEFDAPKNEESKVEEEIKPEDIPF